MKNLVRTIVCLLLIVSVVTGCGNKETASKENNKQIESTEDLSKKHDIKENENSTDEMIDGDTLESKKAKGEKAIVLAGNPAKKEYDSLLSTIRSIAEKRNMAVYTLDISDKENEGWKNENDDAGDMNVVIMTNGYKIVCNMDTEDLYQEEVLNRLVDTIISQLESM